MNTEKQLNALQINAQQKIAILDNAYRLGLRWVINQILEKYRFEFKTGEKYNTNFDNETLMIEELKRITGEIQTLASILEGQGSKLSEVEEAVCIRRGIPQIYRAKVIESIKNSFVASGSAYRDVQDRANGAINGVIAVFGITADDLNQLYRHWEKIGE